MLPFDLHVLSIPPAFNLSQDQTLQLNSILSPKTTDAEAPTVSIERRTSALKRFNEVS